MIDDDGKLHIKYGRKKDNAKRDGIGFNLTFSEYRALVKQAGLKSSDLGYSGRNYVLARVLDMGPYEVGNCRFITQKENMGEWVMSSRSEAKRLDTIRRRSGKPLIQETVQHCPMCDCDFFSSKILKVCSPECRAKLLSKLFAGKSIGPGGKPAISEATKNRIKKLHESGLSSYKISDLLGIARNTVMKYW